MVALGAGGAPAAAPVAPQGAPPANDLRVAPDRATNLLRARIVPDDASVWLDGELLGQGRELAGRIEAPLGHHELVVIRRGYSTEVRSLDVSAGPQPEVWIELTQVAPAD